MNKRGTQVLLVVVAVLLVLNLAVTVADLFVTTPEAKADIVSGKNWFTTTSDEGGTVHLWQYWANGVGPHASAEMKYYGMIKAGGSFQPVK